MQSHETSNMGVILVAPGSVLRSFLSRMLAQQGGVMPPIEQEPASVDESEPPQIIVEPLSPDTLEHLSHLIEGTPPVPVLLFCEPDTFRALLGRKAFTGGDLPATHAVGEDLLNAVLTAGGGGQRLGALPKMPVGVGFEGLLSAREVEVLELLAEGASNKQISEALSISPNTVYTHVRHIQDKLRTANRTQTALLARTLLGQLVS